MNQFTFFDSKENPSTNPVQLATQEPYNDFVHYMYNNLIEILHHYYIINNDQKKYFEFFKLHILFGLIFKRITNDNDFYKLIFLGVPFVPQFAKEFTIKLPKGFPFNPEYSNKDYAEFPNIPEFSPQAVAYTLYLILICNPSTLGFQESDFRNYSNIKDDSSIEFHYKGENITPLYNYFLPRYL